MTLKYIWRSFQPRLSFPRSFQLSLACFRVAWSPSNSWASCLKILKRNSLSSDDLVYFYTAFIRPILEYACPAWHNSLTNEQSRQIESVQKRALSIIFDHTCAHCDELCSYNRISTLYNRRVELCRSFFNQSVLDKNSCLHYLLPPPRTCFVNKLRSCTPYVPQTAKTTRFQNSFIIYALNNYQT